MSYDLYAGFSEWSGTQNENYVNLVPPFLRRYFAFRVHEGIVNNNDSERDEYKKRAADNCAKTSVWQKDFSEIMPGAATPFLNTGLGIELIWTLKTPVFSRSESEFDALDNPLTRDRISGLPVLRAAGAKGMLRQLVAAEDEGLALKLFGRSSDENETDSYAGRVVFGNVEFQSVDKDVFSPHDHHFGVVDHPIFFEVVAAGSPARWGMLVTTLENADCRREMSILFEAIGSLLYDYGMSAKRSSGYGIAEPGLKIRLRPGRRVVLPEKFLYREGSEFSEPRPQGPAKTMAEPEFFSLLSDGEKMLVEREETLAFLLRHKFPKIKKSDKKSDRKNSKKVEREKSSFKKKWEKKDAAGKLWERCEKFIAQQRDRGLNSEAELELQNELVVWEERRAQHEAARQSYYEFSDLRTAIKTMREELTIKS